MVLCHPSKFTNMYLECDTFVSPKRIKDHKHTFSLGKLHVALADFTRLSVPCFSVTFPGAHHVVYAKSQVFCGKEILK